MNDLLRGKIQLQELSASSLDQMLISNKGFLLEKGHYERKSLQQHLENRRQHIGIQHFLFDVYITSSENWHICKFQCSFQHIMHPTGICVTDPKKLKCGPLQPGWIKTNQTALFTIAQFLIHRLRVLCSFAFENASLDESNSGCHLVQGYYGNPRIDPALTLPPSTYLILPNALLKSGPISIMSLKVQIPKVFLWRKNKYSPLVLFLK